MENNSQIVFEYKGGDEKNVIWNSIVLLAFIVVGLAPYVMESLHLFRTAYAQTVSDMVKIIFPITVAAVVVTLLYFVRKTYKKFSVNEQGIMLNDKICYWERVKNYHMLGDSQDERIGLTGVRNLSYDVINVYSGMGIFVLKLHGLMQKTIRLRVSPDRVNEFVEVLKVHGIERESTKHMFFTNVNPWFILLFAIPFGLFPLLVLLFLVFFRG